MECIRLGAKPGSDFSGLQAIAKAMCDTAADEAVTAATLFVTEDEIAQACNDFALTEQTAGRLANVVRLRQAAQMILKSVDHARGAEIKATVQLRSAVGSLPPAIDRRVEGIGRLIAHRSTTSLAPLRRLVAELIGEAHEAGFRSGEQTERSLRDRLTEGGLAETYSSLQGSGYKPVTG